MSEPVVQRRSWLWLQGLACGAALSFATGPAVLVGALLMPGIASYFFERTPGKPLSESMLLLGLATTFVPFRTLWEHGLSLDACLTLLAEPSHLGLSWLAAACGWMMGEAAQLAGRQLGEIAMRRRMTTLRRELAELIDEWGSLEPRTQPQAPRRR
jgi:hypothetical protein